MQTKMVSTLSFPALDCQVLPFQITAVGTSTRRPVQRQLHLLHQQMRHCRRCSVRPQGRGHPYLLDQRPRNSSARWFTTPRPRDATRSCDSRQSAARRWRFNSRLCPSYQKNSRRRRQQRSFDLNRKRSQSQSHSQTLSRIQSCQSSQGRVLRSGMRQLLQQLRGLLLHVLGGRYVLTIRSAACLIKPCAGHRRLQRKCTSTKE